jgi:hypothetical protein
MYERSDLGIKDEPFCSAVAIANTADVDAVDDCGGALDRTCAVLWERLEAGLVVIRQSIIRLQLAYRRGRWCQRLYEGKGEAEEVKQRIQHTIGCCPILRRVNVSFEAEGKW